jgi:hypothetical protein
MIGSIPPPYSDLGTTGRRASGVRRVGIGLVTALIGGLAVATLASGSSDKTPPTAQAAPSHVAPAETTATPIPTPTATLTPTATAITTATPKFKPLRKTRRRPGIATHPNSTDEAPVRLPISGL